MSEDASSLTPLERRAKVEKETKEEIEKLKQDLQKAKEETQKYKDTHTKPIDPRKDLEPKPSKGEIIVNVKEGKFLLACDVGGTSDPFLVISLKDRVWKNFFFFFFFFFFFVIFSHFHFFIRTARLSIARKALLLRR